MSSASSASSASRVEGLSRVCRGSYGIVPLCSGVLTMLVSALCYASMVLVAYWLHSCTSHCMASIHIANLHATPLLVSLPPLQAACTFWGLALLADLHCSVGIVWVGQHCAMLASCLATPILLVSLINVYSSFLATFASQPELWGLALRADLHCSVGIIVWVPTLLPCWHHCLPHPLLVSLINVCASFLATSASNLNCGNRCCVPICIAASALFGLTNIAAMMAA